MQVSRIGWVAPQSERLSSPWRRRLPRHRILHRGFKCSAVWWRYLQSHFHQPGANRRKRKFFGMNHLGDAHQPPIAGRCPCRLHCAHRYEYRACQPYRGGNGEFHDVFPSERGLNAKRAKTSSTACLERGRKSRRPGRSIPQKSISVGWVERPDRTLVRSDRETHRRAVRVDGFREGLNPSVLQSSPHMIGNFSQPDLPGLKSDRGFSR
jgi:hypothetical protein